MNDLRTGFIIKVLYILIIFRAGQLDYDIAFNLALYIKKESKFVPWRTLLDSINYLENMLRKQDVYGKFKVKLSYRNPPRGYST